MDEGREEGIKGERDEGWEGKREGGREGEYRSSFKWNGVHFYTYSPLKHLRIIHCSFTCISTSLVVAD